MSFIYKWLVLKDCKILPSINKFSWDLNVLTTDVKWDVSTGYPCHSYHFALLYEHHMGILHDNEWLNRHRD